MRSSTVRRVVVTAGAAVLCLLAVPAYAQTTAEAEDDARAEEQVTVVADEPGGETDTSGSGAPVGDADEDGAFEPAPVLESGEGGDEVVTITGGIEADGDSPRFDPVIAESGPVELADEAADDQGTVTVVALAAAAAIAAAGAGAVAVRRRS